MKRPIRPLFGKIVSESDEALEQVKFKIRYAKSEVRLLDEGKVYIQYYRNYLYYMEVWEIWLHSDVVLPFEVLDFSLFLFFMLEGRASFSNDDGTELAEAEQSTCYATINTSGGGCLYLSKGKHILTYGCPRIEWLMRYQDSFPLLVEFVCRSQSQLAEATYMKKIHINRSIGRCLFNLWQFTPKDESDLEFELSKRFKLLFKLYYDQIVEKGKLSFFTTEEKIAEVNNYLKQYFSNPDIGNVTLLCDRFLLTERTFSRVFYKVNNKSLASYLNELRLEYACELLRNNGLSIKKISTMCGFKSFNYFSRVFRNRFASSPSKWRRSQLV